LEEKIRTVGAVVECVSESFAVGVKVEIVCGDGESCLHGKASWRCGGGSEVCEEIVGGGEWDDFVPPDSDAAGGILHGWVVWSPYIAKASEMSALRVSDHVWRNGVVRPWPGVYGELLKPLADGGRLGLVKSPALRRSAHCAEMAVAGVVCGHGCMSSKAGGAGMGRDGPILFMA
jgi:hypothetical protein